MINSNATLYGPNSRAVEAFLLRARKLTAAQAGKLKVSYERELAGLPHDDGASATMLWRDAWQAATAIGMEDSVLRAHRAATAAVELALARLAVNDPRRVAAGHAAAAAVLALAVRPIGDFFQRLYLPWAEVIDGNLPQ